MHCIARIMLKVKNTKALLICITLSCLQSSTFATMSCQDLGHLEIDNRCFQLYSTVEKSWYAAMDECCSRNGNLATIDNVKLFYMLQTKYSKVTSEIVWIGLRGRVSDDALAHSLFWMCGKLDENRLMRLDVAMYGYIVMNEKLAPGLCYGINLINATFMHASCDRPLPFLCETPLDKTLLNPSSCQSLSSDYRCHNELPTLHESGTTADAADLVPSFPMTPTERTVSSVILSLGSMIVISLIGVVLITFLILRNRTFERLLHMTQEVAIVLAQLMILCFREATNNGNLCKITAAILQFSYTLYFVYCLFEALQTYCIVTSVILHGGFAKRITILVGGVAVSAIVTGLTAMSFYDEYPATYSCWVNYSSNVYYAILCPITATVIVTTIILEACSMYLAEPLELTNQRQLSSAKINRRGLTLIMPISFAAMIMGTLTLYYQRFVLYTMVFGLNVTAGILSYMFHTVGDEQYRRAIGLFVQRVKAFLKTGRCSECKTFEYVSTGKKETTVKVKPPTMPVYIRPNVRSEN